MSRTSNSTSDPGKIPRLSIGLPVYNGAQFLDRCLEALCSQTFRDWELIICDNASNDRTVEIAERWRARDARIQISLANENMGAAANFNKAFSLARAELFKWCAVDDLLEPDFIQHCIDALDRNPDAVLAYSGAVDIDEEENFIREIYDNKWDVDFGAPETDRRFRYLICADHSCIAIFGVIRTAVLRQTAVIAPYVGSDRVLLAVLGLHGKLLRVGDRLLLHREHKGRSVNEVKDLRKRAAWFDPRKSGSNVYPHWRYFVEYTKAVCAVQLSIHMRMRCAFELVRWLRRGYWLRLMEDLMYYLPGRIRATADGRPNVLPPRTEPDA
jgi:glycosyltransferase involved in cell wall biosynthesis